MSRWAKISWLIAGLCIVIVFAARYILGAWHNFLFVPLAIFCIFFVIAVVVDIKFYFELFTLRTTKKGMSMGVLILMVLALLIGVNFLSIKFNKTIDLTAEKLNSLADQSVGILDNLKSDVKILVFYRGEKDRDKKAAIKNVLDLYAETNSKAKVQYLNAYVETGLAQEYLSRGDQLTVFVEYAGRKIRVEEPQQEEQITSALLKATRVQSKKIYVLKGHGERSIESADEEDIKDFKQALEDSSFEVSDLSLISGEKIPEDTAVIAIIGPRTQLLDAEIQELSDYAKRGGDLFIAADPGQRHNVAQLLKVIGIDYKANFILNDRVQLKGQGLGGALGLLYDGNHDITKKFRSGENFSLFSIASEVVKSKDAPTGIEFTEIVRTPPSSFAASSLMAKQATGDRRFFSIGLVAKGNLSGEKEKTPEPQKKTNDFTAVVFGDSDFLSNIYLFQGVNRDLAINSIAFLAKETDLISIRPKKPKGTKLNLTSTTQNSVVLAGLGVPLVFFILSGFFWYRRRNA